MINCIGTLAGCSGYDAHFRQLANALNKITDVRVTTQLTQQQLIDLTDEELKMVKKDPEKDEINLIITHPLNWKLNLNAKRNWVFLVWEGDKVPKCFIEECLNDEIEYIFVPSEHTKKAILNTCGQLSQWRKNKLDMTDSISAIIKLKDKIKVMPHGVDTKIFYSKEKPKKTTFIMNKGFRNLEDRGGIQYGIKAYLDEFEEKDDVEMVIKINPAYGIPNMQMAVNKLRPNKKCAPIKVIAGNIPFNKLVDLYNQGTVFISPTRAEAFNLPVLEAMACELPIITTDFGGQTDYVTSEHGALIEYDLAEVKHELAYEGINWAIPSQEHLKGMMRDAYNNPEKWQLMGSKAMKTAQEWSWDNTSKKIKSLI